MCDINGTPSCENKSPRKLNIQKQNTTGDQTGTIIIGERVIIDETFSKDKTLPIYNPIIIGKVQDSCQTPEIELKCVSKSFNGYFQFSLGTMIHALFA